MTLSFLRAHGIRTLVCCCARGVSSAALLQRRAAKNSKLHAMRVKQNNDFGPIRAPGNNDCWRPTTHLCCTAHTKNVISPFFCTNLRLEAPLPVHFSCTTFRRSATTSATLLILKCTTRRWTLRCSNYKYSGKATAVFVRCKHRDIVAEV